MSLEMIPLVHFPYFKVKGPFNCRTFLFNMELALLMTWQYRSFCVELVGL